ncbi:AraC family transcriptional regulator [Chitiniphilus eburneus]|uniref:AraC family transcriptional regulator n=1 Tax=Chitiniphilus eburneus TaxID=2571148 RepID=A0A4U0PZV2_9NEIS|nr:AraC family transcriptional regulator [Chitiniphilus eburneus]TJZ73222.1 AraC family transcriptional regulator [Chitiniphilus eburneus]
MFSSHRAIRIERAVDLIHQRYSNELTLDEMAAQACYSNWHFVRAFEAEIGEAPFDFLRKRRLYAAAYRLLSDARISISELSTRCGFQYASSFSKGFRRQFGMTARDWRAGGWQHWVGEQPWHAATQNQPARHTLLEHDAEQVRLVDPQSFSIEIVPAQPVVYRRLRGLWGDCLNDAAQQTLRDSPLPLPLCYGARHDFLHLRGPVESCYDLCVPVASDYAVPPTMGRASLFGGRYAVRRLAPHEPYLSWRSVLASWPNRARHVFDTRRPMIELYGWQGEHLCCTALYLPLAMS